MLRDVVHPPPPQEQLLLEDTSSPTGDQMFSFCENELLLNSEISSSSNYFYEDNSCCNNVSISSCNNNNNSISSNISGTTDLSFMYNVPQEDSQSLCFMSTPAFSIPQMLTSQEDQYDISALPPLNNCVDGLVPYQPELIAPESEVQLPLAFGDDCFSLFSGCGNLDSTSSLCSVTDPIMGQFMPGSMSAALSADASGIYDGNVEVIQPTELGFQGENIGVYGSELGQQCFSSGDMQQALCNDIQQPMSEVWSSTLTSEISSIEESAYKVGRLSVEERKERIHRYIKKRNARNFSKKIKYVCRKTLADSRPRVRGRFARNGEFGEGAQPHVGNQEDEDDHEVTVKKEADMVDSANIFGQGLSSFKCNYPLQTWT